MNDLSGIKKIINIAFKNSNFSWLVYFYEGKIFN